jgi:flagellin-like hook-associated protein FlgL
VHSILQRVRDLSVQAANDGANSTTSLDAIQSEIDELGTALLDIADRTDFNGKKLLNGDNATLTFQVGANSGETKDVTLTDITAVVTAVSAINVTTGAASGITATDTQIGVVSAARATLGASQNSFEHTINNLNVAVENCPRRRAASGTPTWPRRWCSSPAARSFPRPAPAGYMRPSPHRLPDLAQHHQTAPPIRRDAQARCRRRPDRPARGPLRG